MIQDIRAALRAVEDVCTAGVSEIDDLFMDTVLDGIPADCHIEDYLLLIPPLAYRGGSYSYPFLLAEAFPSLCTELVQQISVSAIYYILAFKMDDWIVDGEVSKEHFCWALFRRQLLYEKARTILRSLFEASSRFWQLHDDYYRELVRANFLERIRHIGVLASYPTEEMEQIAKGKTSLAKLIPAGLAILADKESKIQPLCRSMEYVAIGNQLYDDVKDWKEDYERRHFSYLLTHAIYKHELQDKVMSASHPETRAIGGSIYYSGTMEFIITEAIRYYEQAIRAVDGLGCYKWTETIRGFQRGLVRLKDDFREIMTRTLQQHPDRDSISVG